MESFLPWAAIGAALLALAYGSRSKDAPGDEAEGSRPTPLWEELIALRSLFVAIAAFGVLALSAAELTDYQMGLQKVHPVVVPTWIVSWSAGPA